MKLAVRSGAVRPGTLGHNKFSDQTSLEMGGSSSKFEITTIDPSDQEMINNYGSDLNDLGYNTLINWCGDSKQACNSIVNQQHNSCKNAGGAFATIAAIESQWKILNDSLVKLSEQ